MATVVLLRHGRTTANAEGTLAGRGPVELDAHGRAQATALHARLTCGPPLAAVVTSPLIRCRQTLDLALPGTSLATEDDLIECGYGRWTGQRLSALATQPLWRAVQDHPAAAGFPDGESLAAMSARAVAAVRRWDQTVTANFGPDAVWLACSHGDIIKAVVADALGLHLDLFQRIVVDPASLTVIRYTPLRAFLMTLNDTGAGLRALRCRPGGSDAAVGGGRGCDDS